MIWYRGVYQMHLDTKVRDGLAKRILECLEQAVPGSEASLRGSLATGQADQYSDIDVLWQVPDDQFQGCTAHIEDILAPVAPIESLRSDIDYQRSDRRRLFFVRFEGLPLFWRLDLNVLAWSLKGDQTYDSSNPAARGDDWSYTESALMNAIGAVKAILRGREEIAVGSLERAYARVGLDMPDLPLRELILHLVGEVAVIDPKQEVLSARIRHLVHEALL